MPADVERGDFRADRTVPHANSVLMSMSVSVKVSVIASVIASIAIRICAGPARGSGDRAGSQHGEHVESRYILYVRLAVPPGSLTPTDGRSIERHMYTGSMGLPGRVIVMDGYPTEVQDEDIFVVSPWSVVRVDLIITEGESIDC